MHGDYADAGEPRTHHHPHVALPRSAAGGRGRAFDPADRAQSSLELDKFTPPGGQVIVSTQLTEKGEVLLRVRDTGVGMSEAEVATAMEPFRQLSTSTPGSGLGLPLTKALTEANRASFSVKSTVNAGTLVEITFPANRVLAG